MDANWVGQCFPNLSFTTIMERRILGEKNGFGRMGMAMEVDWDINTGDGVGGGWMRSLGYERVVQ